VLRRIYAAMVIAITAIAGSVVAASPASASGTSNFYVCGPLAGCSYEATFGQIIWHNRTATVQGEAWNDGVTTTIAVFQAYAGSTLIDSESVSVVEGSLPINFNIGDPDLRGGINRIKITVCYEPAPRECGNPINYSEPITP